MLLEVSSVTAIRIFSPNLSTIYIHICMVDYTSWTLKNIFFNVFLCVILNSLFIYSNHCLQRYMKFAFINFVDLINDTILATEFVGAVRSKRPRTIPAAYRQTNTRKEASALYGRCRLSNTFRGRFFFWLSQGILIFKYIIRGLFSEFLSRGPHPEHRRKYSRVYSESSFNDDSVFCSKEIYYIGSHSEFLPIALNSKFLDLEAKFLNLFLGLVTQHFDYLESWLKDDSGYILEYFLRCSGWGSFWEELKKRESFHKQRNWPPSDYQLKFGKDSNKKAHS